MNCKQYLVGQNVIYCSNNTILQFLCQKLQFPLVPLLFGCPCFTWFYSVFPLRVHLFYSVLLSFALPINISSLFPLLVLLSFPHLSHGSWLVDSSTYDRTVCISLSTSMDAYGEKSAELAVAYSSRIFLSPISSLTLAVAAARNCSMRATVRNCSVRATAWI